MRISGIASGMDTETMVKDIMKAERVKLDKINQSKQLSVWKQEQYNETNKSIAQFILDTKTELFGTYSYSKTVDSLTWVKKATSSDESVFTATASAKATEGTHNIKVTQLAEGVKVASQSPVKVGATSSTKLSELGIADGSITFKVGDKTKTIDFKATDPTDPSSNPDDINTVGKLVAAINNASEDGESLGLQANFDDVNGRLFLSTKETGENAKILITNDSENLFVGATNKFKVLKDDGLTPIFVDTLTEVKGTNAKIDFDGAKNLEYPSNNISVNGINFNLNSISADEITIKVDTDVDGVYDKIKGFVNKYNELIENLNKKTSEKRYRDFKPLTAEEKEAMKEDDIKLWEGKAKSGLLRNDEYIDKLMQTARSGLYAPSNEGDGAFDQLFEIGITTGSWKDKGKLVISEDPDTGLKAKIKEDPKAVLDLLFAPSDANDSSKSGIVNRMYDDMVDGMKEMINKSGTGDNSDIYRKVKSSMLIDFVTGGKGRPGSISLLDEAILKFDKSVSREESRLSSVEGRYWKKFSAMEQALSKMNSQSSWLAGQLGAM
ncbi:flagellar filament capping protein FliD [Lutibacter sp. B2]|nr:flagellar filament capping protein FliD [Lutibacter sp. B2]